MIDRKAGIVRELYAVEQPIDLDQFGPALVAAGYTEQAIVSALAASSMKSVSNMLVETERVAR